MVSAEREPMGVWGLSSQWDPGDRPLVQGPVGEAPLKLIRFQQMGQIIFMKTCIKFVFKLDSLTILCTTSYLLINSGVARISRQGEPPYARRQRRPGSGEVSPLSKKFIGPRSGLGKCHV